VTCIQPGQSCSNGSSIACRCAISKMTLVTTRPLYCESWTSSFFLKFPECFSVFVLCSPALSTLHCRSSRFLTLPFFLSVLRFCCWFCLYFQIPLLTLFLCTANNQIRFKPRRIC
jgi:hypothetical protein